MEWCHTKVGLNLGEFFIRERESARVLRAGFSALSRGAPARGRARARAAARARRRGPGARAAKFICRRAGGLWPEPPRNARRHPRQRALWFVRVRGFWLLLLGSG